MSSLAVTFKMVTDPRCTAFLNYTCKMYTGLHVMENKHKHFVLIQEQLMKSSAFFWTGPHLPVNIANAIEMTCLQLQLQFHAQKSTGCVTWRTLDCVNTAGSTWELDSFNKEHNCYVCHIPVQSYCFVWSEGHKRHAESLAWSEGVLRHQQFECQITNWKILSLYFYHIIYQFIYYIFLHFYSVINFVHCILV